MGAAFGLVGDGEGTAVAGRGDAARDGDDDGDGAGLGAGDGESLAGVWTEIEGRGDGPIAAGSGDRTAVNPTASTVPASANDTTATTSGLSASERNTERIPTPQFYGRWRAAFDARRTTISGY